jgi:hypothetical protein
MEEKKFANKIQQHPLKNLRLFFQARKLKADISLVSVTYT